MDIMQKMNPEEKVVLMLLPFWPPLIPPLGITSIKTFLKPYGYDVKTVDANVKTQLGDFYHHYFDALKSFIEPSKRGNFYNIGHAVWENHALAYLSRSDEIEYNELVHMLIQKTFFSRVSDRQIETLNQILDQFYEGLEAFVRELLIVEKPTLLGLSIYSGTLPASLFSLKLAKEIDPGVTTVVGGGIFADVLSPDSRNLDYLLEQSPFIDKVIVGEGELLFLNLLQGKFPDSQKIITLDDIDREVVDISQKLLPDFSDYPLKHYPYMAANTSRSCPFQCKFCAETVNWGKYRKKDSRQVAEELVQMYEIYGSQLFLMCDSLLNPIINDLSHNLLKREPAVYWDGYLRVDHPAIDMDNSLLWRRAGFYRARLGIESGSQHVLDLMDKRITVDQTKNALLNLARVGIKTTSMWVIGFPGETEDDFRMTLDLVEEYKDYIYEADCNPFVYHPSGQVNSSNWAKENKKARLFPEKFRPMLKLERWFWDAKPTREETFNRLTRFVTHCANLGIPNPYTLFDIYKADERWQRLHGSAVPALVEFKNRTRAIDECRAVKKRTMAQKKIQADVDFAM